MPKVHHEVFNHIISFSRDGEYVQKTSRSRKKYLKNPSFFEPNVSPVDTILQGLEEYDRTQKLKGKDTRIVFFVHGGLVTETTAIKRINRMYKHIKKDAYPIFILWRSGLPATYGSHLTRIRQGEVRESAKITAPIYFLTDVVDVVTHAPVAWLTAGTHSIRTGLLTDRADVNSSLEQVSKSHEYVTFEGNRKEPSTAINRSIWMATSVFKAAVTPLVYTIAKPAWEVMLRRTNTITDPVVTPKQATTFSLPVYDDTVGGIELLIEGVSALAEREEKSNRNISMDFIGHSMGAIIVNKLLNKKLAKQVDNIVHMASADTIDSMFSSVIPYLQNNVNSRFYSLHLHPENENRERNVAGIAPSGSLLIWIDEMYTSPDSVFSRRSGNWENIARVLNRLPSDDRVLDRIRFKVFGLDATKVTRDPDKGIYTLSPQKHGSFSGMKYWESDTWQ